MLLLLLRVHQRSQSDAAVVLPNQNCDWNLGKTNAPKENQCAVMFDCETEHQDISHRREKSPQYVHTSMDVVQAHQAGSPHSQGP
jgi:hypothetical protein